MSTKGSQSPPLPRLLSAGDVAEILGVSTKQVRRLSAELGGFKVGRLLRFDPERIEAYLAERRAEAEREAVGAAT